MTKCQKDPTNGIFLKRGFSESKQKTSVFTILHVFQKVISFVKICKYSIVVAKCVTMAFLLAKFVNMTFLSQKFVNAVLLSQKFVNTAFFPQKCVNTAFLSQKINEKQKIKNRNQKTKK